MYNAAIAGCGDQSHRSCGLCSFFQGLEAHTSKLGTFSGLVDFVCVRSVVQGDVNSRGVLDSEVEICSWEGCIPSQTI